MKDFKRNCHHCGSEYRNVYKTGGAYNTPYTIETKYCSKSCAQLAKSRTPDELLNDITNTISSAGRYLTGSEIQKSLKVSSKTISKYKLSVAEMNAMCGFNKPTSAFEQQVGNVIKETFPDVLEQATFDGLEGAKGHPLRVDFFLPDIGLVVEADGPQHSLKDHPWASSNPNGSVAEYDQIKDSYFENRNLKVIRIPYKRNVSSRHVLKYFLV